MTDQTPRPIHVVIDALAITLIVDTAILLPWWLCGGAISWRIWIDFCLAALTGYAAVVAWYHLRGHSGDKSEG